METSLILFVLVGLAAGWLAGHVMKGGGQQVQKDYVESCHSRKDIVINHITSKFARRSSCYEKEKYVYQLFGPSYADRSHFGLRIDIQTVKHRGVH